MDVIPGLEQLPRDELLALVTKLQQQLQLKSRNELVLAASNQVLEYVSKGAQLEQILSLQCIEAERLYPGMLASVLKLDESKKHLHHCASVSLPQFYLDAIDGIAIGEGIGSCGTAAHRKQRVLAEDIDKDPFWQDFKELALKAGLQACWSEPIISPSGELFGTFAMYYPSPRSPEVEDLSFIANQASIAGIVFAHDQAEKKLARHTEILESEVKGRTQELEKSLQALTNAQQQLIESEKNSAIGLLVASIAHDVNTPLGIAVTAASSLKQQVSCLSEQVNSGQLNKKQLTDFLNNSQELLQLTESSLQRGIDIIGNFKNVAVDQSSHQKREFLMYEFLEEVVSSLSPKMKKLKVKLDVQCDKQLKLVSYPGDLFQIMTNLVLNSLNHAFEDVEQPAITIAITTKAKRVCLDYSDNGCGMPEEIRLHVFEPFVTTKSQEGGSGLGMHIVHSLVTQKLQGNISALDCPVGVHFRFCIPAEI